MKKSISVLIVLFLLSFCLSFTVSAEDMSFTISEDYKTLYLDGNTYSRVDISTLSVEFTELHAEYAVLTEAQKETIRDMYFQANEARTVIYADFYFKDGSQLSVGFLQDSYRDVYESLIADDSAKCVIDFYWPEGNTVTTQIAQLRGEAVELYNQETLEWCDWFDVTAQSPDGNLSAIRGSLLIYDNEYYFVDFQENGILNPSKFYPGEYDHLNAYKITHETLLKSITKAEEAYYSDSFGFFYDDDFTEGLSAVFLVFVFAVIPAAVFLAALIFTIRTKDFYRRVWGSISVLSAAELAIFVILTAIILMPK